MDPDANLEEQIKLALGMVDEDIDKHTASDTANLASRGQRLAELVLALDDWLAKGGFKPKRWRVK